MTRAHAAPVRWFFDFISPFAYLQWQRIKGMDRYAIEYRPILFAGLLDHFGHKGPAEIAPKRAFTYRHAQWRADRDAIELTFPPAHPFNPLTALRVCIAAGGDAPAIDAIFNHIWRDGCAGDTLEALEPVTRALGLADPVAATRDPLVKSRLRGNFDLALESGVFGVPTLVAGAEVFWGEDATDMFEAYMASPESFDTPRMKRLARLPTASTRPGAA